MNPAEIERLLSRPLTHVERQKVDWMNGWEKDTQTVVMGMLQAVYEAGEKKGAPAVAPDLLEKYKERMVNELDYHGFVREESYTIMAHAIMSTDLPDNQKFEYVQVLDDVYTDLQDKEGKL
ncbi:hypothetical protein [Paenibacillus amylolyticus]|uniref:hypothetical protein n=1 Tax=Paenibacillus amylolyticus TaxID=1451 RepID=UPI000B841E4A|nr:hypothetical protein [Paenibacillus amylolyticus]